MSVVGEMERVEKHRINVGLDFTAALRVKCSGFKGLLGHWPGPVFLGDLRKVTLPFPIRLRSPSLHGNSAVFFLRRVI